METVKGVVEAAERALLGDGTSQSREEPASVVQGEGTARDAYDAGNASGQPGEHFRDPAAESTANQERQSTRRPEMPRELTAGEPAGEEAAADDQGTKTSQATPKAGQYQGNPLSHGEQTEPKDADGGHQGYVRSTGFAADGGNFDARQPGAGREADRLREEQGIMTSQEAKSSTASGTAGRKASRTGSHGGISKVKEKLHIGKHQA